MFDITILTVGKIKEPYFQSAAKEYLKRLAPFAKIDVYEIKPEPFGAGNKTRSKDIEGARILAFLGKHQESVIIILDEKGENFTSIEFAKTLEKSNQHIIFVIGGSLGLDKKVLGKPWLKLSLSQLTFPHEMSRLILLEQIYRAATIVCGKEYHH